MLYFDTDSIIYASNGLNDPPLGNFLGEFTDELGGETIVKFVSGMKTRQDQSYFILMIEYVL